MLLRSSRLDKLLFLIGQKTSQHLVKLFFYQLSQVMCTALDFALLFAENHSPGEAAITTTTTLRDLVNSVPKNRQVVSKGDDPSKVLGKNQASERGSTCFSNNILLIDSTPNNSTNDKA